MKKIASVLMGLAMLATTAFGHPRQESNKTTTQTKTTKQATTHSNQSGSPKLKKDGTLDKRYKENKTTTTTETGPLKKDGTPDKRFKKNKG